MTSIASIMTEYLFTLTADETLADVKALMATHGIRHIPIIDEQKNLLGIVSQRDVLAIEDSILQAESPSDKYSNIVKFEIPIKISEFYKSDVITIPPQTTVHKAALTLQKYKIGCLPVVANGKLLGLVTDTDFVNVAINLMEVMEMA